MIRARREHIGITQRRLGARIGVSQTAVAKSEKPNARPRRATLEKIAEALGISIENIAV